MRTVLLDCPSCGGDREFEAPPCRDGHGEDCPDLVCVGCGTALVTGLVLLPPVRRPARAARAA